MRSRVADILGQSGISDGIRGIDSVIQRFAPEAQKITRKWAPFGSTVEVHGSLQLFLHLTEY